MRVFFCPVVIAALDRYPSSIHRGTNVAAGQKHIFACLPVVFVAGEHVLRQQVKELYINGAKRLQSR